MFSINHQDLLFKSSGSFNKKIQTFQKVACSICRIVLFFVKNKLTIVLNKG